MTIQQTLTIPKATRHLKLRLDLVEPVPAGTVDVALSFPDSSESEDSLESADSSESKNPWMDWDFHQPLPEPRSIEEALQMGDARVAAVRADPSLGIAKFQGCMKDSPTFFPGDVVATIRKMRDEWDAWDD
ncbi:hypothetical protein FACS189485_10490 [Spirochaetia bacterium]|nr:hypothetical protein FACS189485_10490 [Spirochaetia bacterium]